MPLFRIQVYLQEGNSRYKGIVTSVLPKNKSYYRAYT
jgi:hypothetical protein